MSSMTPLYSWFDDLKQYQKIFYYLICNIQLRTTFVCIEQVHVSFINHKDSCIIPYLHPHTYTNKPPNTHNKYPPPPSHTNTHTRTGGPGERTHAQTAATWPEAAPITRMFGKRGSLQCLFRTHAILPTRRWGSFQIPKASAGRSHSAYSTIVAVGTEVIYVSDPSLDPISCFGDSPAKAWLFFSDEVLQSL